MKKFKFFLVKAVAWYPKFKTEEKTIVVEANDLMEARSIIQRDYDKYEVSMFWPVV